jgi:hypothetical protein
MIATQTTTQDVGMLTGSWPVRMHADKFFGTVKADGQHPRVAALACYQGDVVAISLVGYDTSVSAVLASLWSRETVPFLVGEEIKWNGPRHLKRRPEPYKQFSVTLEGTKEVHYTALPASAHIAEGIFHPPDLPSPPKQEHVEMATAQRRAAPPSPPPPSAAIDRSRFVLGNWDEEYPHERSFLGTLYGMRVLFLHKDEEHPEWPRIWAKEIWARGCTRKLIQPLKETLGMKAWVVSGDLQAWGRLIGDGAREGWLPWRTATPPPDEHAREIATLQRHALHDALALSGMLNSER